MACGSRADTNQKEGGKRMKTKESMRDWLAEKLRSKPEKEYKHPLELKNRSEYIGLLGIFSFIIAVLHIQITTMMFKLPETYTWSRYVAIVAILVFGVLAVYCLIESAFFEDQYKKFKLEYEKQ